MALTTAQTRVAFLALHLPAAEGFVLAGGGAMLAHGLVDRPTHYLDLFSADAAALPPLAAALTRALDAAGMTVTSGHTAPGYQQLTVAVGDETVLVELANDVRMWPAKILAVGSVLSIEELAADKTLALFGRAEPRDLVDVAALAATLGADRLLEFASAKDADFDQAVLGDAVRFAAAQPDSRFTSLGLTPAGLTALRHWAQSWHQQLTGASPDAAQAPDVRAASAVQQAAQAYPAPLRALPTPPRRDPSRRRGGCRPHLPAAVAGGTDTPSVGVPKPS